MEEPSVTEKDLGSLKLTVIKFYTEFKNKKLTYNNLEIRNLIDSFNRTKEILKMSISKYNSVKKF